MPRRLQMQETGVFSLPVTSHQSPVHQSPVTSHQSPVTSHQSPVTSHQSPVTSHQSMTKLVPNTAPPGKEIATLAGGCFWCLEAVYDQLKGVESVESGYTGGQVINPTYQQVCDGDTGHAEVVRITYDPKVVSFGDLLDVFFVIHDPTQLNRQGNDVGTQYRSAVFYHTPEQKRIAQEKIAALAEQGVYDDRIVTEIAEAGPVLRGGGLPPGVLRQESLPGLLHGGGRAEGRQVPQALHRQAQA